MTILGCRKLFLVITDLYKNELFNFASITSPQSAPGSPSKASDLDFMMLNKLDKYESLWRGTRCPITHVETDHYRHARQVLW